MVHKTASVWDLDGTLLNTDVFAEGLIRLVLKQPVLVFAAALLAIRSKSICKGWVASRSNLALDQWPIRDEVMTLLAASRAAGEKTVLATAAHATAANKIAEQVGLFDAVLASTDDRNLKGHVKYLAIANWLNENQCERFTYAGDSAADLHVWRHADKAIAVAPTPRLENQVRKLGKPVVVVGNRPSLARAVFRSLRPHQWTKNLLVFVPMVAGHRFDMPTVTSGFVAFATFSLAASAVYVLNDIVDLGADRLHPTKCRRPLASGALPLPSGITLLCLLALSSFAGALLCLPPAFCYIIAAYLAANVIYSLFFKTQPVVDVLVLSSLYGARLYSGGAATGIELSAWLMAFSMFFFLSLAFAKRYAELRRMSDEGRTTLNRRAYTAEDKDLLATLGASAGYVSVLVLALYMNSEQMRAIYGDSHLLWLVCPAVLLWITRLWFVAHRGLLNEDPVVFALRDRLSIGVGICCAALFVLAIVFRT